MSITPEQLAAIQAQLKEMGRELHWLRQHTHNYRFQANAGDMIGSVTSTPERSPTPECKVNAFMSNMCSRGVKSCIIDHEAEALASCIDRNVERLKREGARLATAQEVSEGLAAQNKETCPQCGYPSKPYFDRSLDEKGDMAMRCSSCGCDVNAPSEKSVPPPSHYGVHITTPPGMSRVDYLQLLIKQAEMPCGNSTPMSRMYDALSLSDVPCPCGDPNHWVVKWQDTPAEETKP